MLRVEGAACPTLRSLDEERVIYLGTLSKIFSAGMRIGWVAAPHPILNKLLLAKQAADLCASFSGLRFQNMSTRRKCSLRLSNGRWPTFPGADSSRIKAAAIVCG